MVVLTAGKLGERQKQLNLKVIQAARDATKLEEINEEDGIEVSTLIKIDLASKYENLDYVLATLKSNDSLYISKVLKKCSFMYKNEYSNYINPDYLQEHIFPTMSSKMKNKLLTEISKKNDLSSERCQSFFDYCIRVKNNDVAFKFLRNTSITFKKNVIFNQRDIVSEMINSSDINIKSFVKESFELAAMILEHINSWTPYTTLLKLSYLFPISNDSYLNMIETFLTVKKNLIKSLSRDMSDTILKKHKSRVLNKPNLYVPMLNKKSLVRYTTPDEAKLYFEALLPVTSNDFYKTKLCSCYSYIINLMRPEEKFTYLKEIFNKHYPEVPFEMSEEFYYNNCYEFMTKEEKETWALRQLDSGAEILGPNKDYLWCKFISFEKAFPIIKSYILKTPLSETRSDIIMSLIYSTGNQGEVEKLLNYYYERHVNEKGNIKEYFLRTVHDHLNIFTFETDCWNAYNKILYSMDIYTIDRSSSTAFSYTLEQIIGVSMFYHISHQLQLPEALIEKLKSVNICVFYRPHFNRLNDDQQNVVLKFLLDFYVNQIKVLADKSQNFTDLSKENVYSVENICNNVLNLLLMYKKKVEDIPKIVMTFFDSYPTVLKNSDFCKFDGPQRETSNINKKRLKDDAQFIIHSFETIKDELKNKNNLLDIRSFVRTLSTYFSHDIAKDFLKLLLESLQNADANVSETFVKTVVYMLFQMTDESHKTKLMLEYAPEDRKIKHDQKDTKKINIQKAICKFACFSRPPVPNKYLIKFILGDYLQYSYHVFWVNLSRLPPPQLMVFIESLLDTPISVQKQAINVAFKCFTPENLCKVLTNAWNKSKNVSLRMVLYTRTVDKMVVAEANVQDDLFKILINFTETLTESDHEIYSSIFRGDIPPRFRGNLLETAWNTVTNTPLSKTQKVCMHNIIRSMSLNISLVNRKCVENIIKQYIDSLSFREEIKEMESGVWGHDTSSYLLLTTTFINHFKDDKSLEFTMRILLKSIEDWNNIDDHKFANAVRKFTVDNIIDRIKYSNSEIINLIIKILEEKVALPQRYDVIISLNLAETVMKTLKMAKHRNQGDSSSSKDIYEYISLYAKNLVELITDLVQNKMFYRSFCSEIACLVKDNVSYICQHLSFFDKNNALENYLAMNLSETKMFETNMLATYILSTGVARNCQEQHMIAVQNVLDFKDDELSFLIYNRVQSAKANNDINYFAKRARYNL